MTKMIQGVWKRGGTLSLALVGGACLLGNFGNTAFSGPNDAGKNPQKALTITEQYNIPIAELSGLAIVRTSAQKKGGIRLYLIGDANFRIANLPINATPNDAIDPSRDVAHVIGRNAGDPSQWEAIAADGKDTICMLSETYGEVSCLDQDLRQDRGSFNLDVSTIASLDSAWKAHSNSRGEGMILMKRGHVLVLKEKQPSMLVEFGPAGDAPAGYGPDGFLQKGEAFIQPPSVPGRAGSLVALKAWAFSERLQELAKDASEITVGPDGRVYLLSQESSTMIRLEKSLRPDEDRVGVGHKSEGSHGEYWLLPKGLEKAEGLVIDDEMRPWIGIDIKEMSKPNLFRLSPINAN